MDAARLEPDVKAKLQYGHALRDNAIANILGVWDRGLAAGWFDAVRSSTSRARAKTNTGGGRYVCYA